MTCFGDAAEPFLAAAGVLPRDQPDPGSQVAAGLEHCRVGDRGDKGAGQHRPNARDIHQASADLGRPRAGNDLPVVVEDLHLHPFELNRKHGQRCTGFCRHPFVIRVGHDREQPVQAFSADRWDDAELRQMGTQRVG